MDASSSAIAVNGSRLSRLSDNWVYGGTLAGIILLGLTPTLTVGWASADVMIFLTLPIYMIHQYEEHDADRFRHFMNKEMGDGREALTRPAVFIINVLGVWAPLAACIVLARSQGAGSAMFAGWLLLVNALVHAGPALKTRTYNPGLFTAIVLFVPLGAAVLVSSWPITSLGQYGIGLMMAILLHAAIMIYIKWRIAHL